jgi:hypothetical protein
MPNGYGMLTLPHCRWKSRAAAAGRHGEAATAAMMRSGRRSIFFIL